MTVLVTICLSIPGACPGDYPEGVEPWAVSPAQHEDPVERWRPLVAREFPAQEVETAMCIIRHESGGNPDADNPRSSASGLFQVLGSMWASHYGVEQADLFQPVINTQIARDIWENYGWSAWSPYNRGNCRSG